MKLLASVHHPVIVQATYRALVFCPVLCQVISYLLSISKGIPAQLDKEEHGRRDSWTVNATTDDIYYRPSDDVDMYNHTSPLNSGIRIIIDDDQNNVIDSPDCHKTGLLHTAV